MRKSVLLILVYTFFLASISVFIYGWYLEGINTSRVEISSANVSSEITVYEAIDYDEDGIFDWYSDDLYSKLEPVDGVISVELSNFKPTDVLSFKVVVENNGDVDGYPFFIVESLKASEFGSCLSVGVCKLVDSSTTPIKIMEWQKVEEIDTATNPYCIIYAGTDDNVIGTTEDTKTASFLIQIKYEAIGENSNDYQAYEYTDVLFSFILSSDKILQFE